MFANPSGEHQGVDTSKDGGHGSDLTSDAIDKEVHCFPRRRRRALEQHGHVAGQSRHPEQSRFLVEQLADRGGRQAPRLDEMQDQTQIHGTTARRHGKPIEGAQAHRGRLATSIRERAQACATSQVSDHGAAAGRQLGGDVLIGKAMEAVGDKARVGEIAWEGVEAC